MRNGPGEINLPSFLRPYTPAMPRTSATR
jgi:hypothetical protein